MYKYYVLLLKMTKSVKINVGGIKFESTIDTLSQASYFRSYFERWDDKEILFIDRSPHIFKHVISLLRDPLYFYPGKYMSELVFYGIYPKDDTKFLLSSNIGYHTWKQFQEQKKKEEEQKKNKRKN